MKIEIIRGGNLKREVWCFSARIDWGTSCIKVDAYSQEHKDNLRQKIWRVDGKWNRLDNRNNKIKVPPLPEDVKAELYQRLSEFVETLPIKF